MEKEKYDKINYYLNALMQDSSPEVQFYQDNLFGITCIGEALTSEAPLKTKEYLKKIRPDYLSHKDNGTRSVEEKEKISVVEVLDLVREVLGKIDEIASTNYVNEFNDMINNGEIDNDYNESDFYQNHYDDSSNISSARVYSNSLNKDILYLNIIQIKPSYDYSDVSTIIHEFMHSRNALPHLTATRSLLTEAVSIFFETFSDNYLITQKGISPDKVRPFDRVLSCDEKIRRLSKIGIELGLFAETGELNDDSFNYIATRLNSYTRDHYEFELNRLYDILTAYEKMYEDSKVKILYENNENDDDYEDYDDFKTNKYKPKSEEYWIDREKTQFVVESLKSYFKDINYIIGTIIAYNVAQKSDSVLKMININNMIKNESTMEEIYYNLDVDILEALVEIQFNTPEKNTLYDIEEKFFWQLWDITDYYYDEEIEKKFSNENNEEEKQHTK